MKTKLFAFCSVICGIANATEPTEPVTSSAIICEKPSTQTVSKSVVYFNIGAGPLPFALPCPGAGFRTQSDHFGVDLSTNIFWPCSPTVLFQYYPKPNVSSQFYMGLGGITRMKSYHRSFEIGLSPAFAVGKEYTSETGTPSFVQADVRFYDELGSFPFVTINYGIGF